MPLSDTSPAAPVPASDEFLVNTQTAADQFNPVIAPLVGGGYAVIWASGQSNQTGNVALIGQVFDADGNKVGSEFTIDSAIDQFPADSIQVEALANGNFVVTWDDISPSAIRAEVFSASGAALTSAFQVNQTPNLSEVNPRIAELSDGDFAIVWTQQSGDLRARVFHADGSAATNEFMVNTTDTGTQNLPMITALAGGGFAIAWQDASAGSNQVDIRAQLFTNSGTFVGSEILVNGTTAGNQDRPALAGLSDGNVVIVWDDLGSTSGDVKAQIIDSSGNKLGSEFLVNSSTDGSQSIATADSQDTARVIALPGGGFAIAWTTSFINFQASSAEVQVFANGGSKIGPETNLATLDPTYWGLRTLEPLHGGGFVVGWDRSATNDVFSTDAVIQVFDGGGRPVGSNVVVHNDTNGDQSLGDLAIGADGRLLTIWTNGLPQGSDPAHVGMDLVGRLFDSLAVQTGTENGDFIQGTAGADLLYGLGGNDELQGYAGNDILVGGAGNDAMVGGLGNDTYIVDSSGDQVFENPGEGNDRIATSVSYQLAPGVSVETLEAITLTDTTPLSLTGNELANHINGNAGDNILDGGAGDDRLEGGPGNDILIGGPGADVMYGNAGNDTFYVQDASDLIYENGGEGVDRVATSVSFTLTAGSSIEQFEAVTLTDTTALNLIGNDLGQRIVGNAGDNLIDGRGGNDVLVGYAGADTFRFSTALGPNNQDRIDDFQHGTDQIALDHAVFTGLTPGSLPASAFVVGTAAGDADDRIIYDPSTGALYFDADGSSSGAAVQFATLTSAPTLTASDFAII